MSRSLMLCTLVALVAAHLLTPSLMAVPVNFTGPAQVVTATVSGSGNVVGAGNGTFASIPFSLDPSPQTASVSLDPPVLTFTTHPLSVGPAKIGQPNVFQPNQTDFEFGGGQLTAINHLGLDLLNGTTLNAATSPVPVSIVLHNGGTDIPVTLQLIGTATLPIGYVEQNGPATLIPTEPGTGTVSLPVDGAYALGDSLSVNGSTLFNYAPFLFTGPATVTGNYTLSGPPGATKVALDGNIDLPVPLNYLGTTLATNFGSLLGFTGTLEVPATVDIRFAYHLESIVAIPEPASIALLGIGLIAMVPAVRRWRRSNVRG